MEIISNFLKNVWQDIKNETSQNSSFIFIVLLLVSIPLKLAIENVIFGAFVIFSIVKFKKQNVCFDITLSIPILLSVLMGLSYFWSVDPEKTLNSLPKVVFLFLMPILFSINPKFNDQSLQKIYKYFSYGILLCAITYLTVSVFRYFKFQDTNVFFYHAEEGNLGLVPKELNAIHLSVFSSLAYLFFLYLEHKNYFQKVALAVLSLFILLLSSKNIILVFVLLNLIYFFYFTKSSNKLRLRNLLILLSLVGAVLFFGRIKQRFKEEFQSNTDQSISHDVLNSVPAGVHYVSIYEAWNNPSFTPNDYFPGTAFRVYQARMFFEILNEKQLFWNGLGYNASHIALEEKGLQYNVYQGTGKEDGYQNKNFHNQYIQNFAEIGFFGFLFLLVMLFFVFKGAIKEKDFYILSFALLISSVFFTESFLWRQRGVVFFILFYCLFLHNGKQLKRNPKK